MCVDINKMYNYIPPYCQRLMRNNKKISPLILHYTDMIGKKSSKYPKTIYYKEKKSERNLLFFTLPITQQGIFLIGTHSYLPLYIVGYEYEHDF